MENTKSSSLRDSGINFDRNNYYRRTQHSAVQQDTGILPMYLLGDIPPDRYGVWLHSVSTTMIQSGGGKVVSAQDLYPIVESVNRARYANMLDDLDLRVSIETQGVSRYATPEDTEYGVALLSALNPGNIIDSAGIWDNADCVVWLYNNVLEPYGIDAVTTDNGLVLVNMDYDRLIGIFTD